MSGFSQSPSGVPGVTYWRGDADGDAQAIAVQRLYPLRESFLGPAEVQPLPLAVLGNLGEFLVYWIGERLVWQNDQTFMPANAYAPLALNSRTGLDLLWMRFGPDTTGSDDLAFLVEVKTTLDPALAVADALPQDMKKLFGKDPRLTLATRLEGAKSELEYVIGEPNLVPRVTKMIASSPSAATKIRLYPVLVHEKATNPNAKLAVVRARIITHGWDPSQVEAWSVALGQFDTRIKQIAMGVS